MAGFTTTDGELSLREMFADPIVQTMMDLDGVTKEDVTGLLRAMRKRMASGADEHHKASRAQGVCPSSKNLRQTSGLRIGGSGSSLVSI